MDQIQPTKQMMASRPLALPSITAAHLWALLALAVVGAFIALVPTAPHDFWWHLKAGELVATRGIPTTNLFAWTLPADAPFTYQGWLAEWLFYVLFRLGGLPLTIFARNALGLAAFALVAWNARIRSGSWRLAAGCVLLAGAMTLNNLTARPQNFSWPLAALVALLLARFAAGRLRARWLWAIPPLMALWANIHGAFVVGLLLLGAYCVGETLRGARRPPGLRTLFLVALASLGAVLLNPQGVGILGYVRSLLGNATVQELISEWQPPTPRSLAGGAFFLGVIVMLACFAFARRRPTISDVLLVCGLAWMGFTSARHVVWFALVALPVAFGCFAPQTADGRRQTADGRRQTADRRQTTNDEELGGQRSAVGGREQSEHGGQRSAVGGREQSELGGQRSAVGGREQSEFGGQRSAVCGREQSELGGQRSAGGGREQSELGGRRSAVGWLFVLLLALPVVLVQPWLKPLLPLPAPYQALFAPVPGAPQLFSSETPVAAAAHLREQPCAGRLFNEQGAGSYLIWANPGQQVFIDPRIELFPDALWQEYVAISQGRDLDALLVRKYDVRCVLLDRILQPRLAAALAADQQWARSFPSVDDGNERAEVWRRVP